MTQDTGAADSETDEERCRRSLFLTNPEIDRQRLIDRKGERVPGTCEWILTDQTYQSWLRDDPGLLWICGCPGKGKTMMSIFITQTLERQNSARTATTSSTTSATVKMIETVPQLPYFEHSSGRSWQSARNWPISFGHTSNCPSVLQLCFQRRGLSSRYSPN